MGQFWLRRVNVSSNKYTEFEQVHGAREFSGSFQTFSFSEICPDGNIGKSEAPWVLKLNFWKLEAKTSKNKRRKIWVYWVQTAHQNVNFLKL